MSSLALDRPSFPERSRPAAAPPSSAAHAPERKPLFPVSAQQIVTGAKRVSRYVNTTIAEAAAGTGEAPLSDFRYALKEHFAEKARLADAQVRALEAQPASTMAKTLAAAGTMGMVTRIGSVGLRVFGNTTSSTVILGGAAMGLRVASAAGDVAFRATSRRNLEERAATGMDAINDRFGRALENDTSRIGWLTRTYYRKMEGVERWLQTSESPTVRKSVIAKAATGLLTKHLEEVRLTVQSETAINKKAALSLIAKTTSAIAATGITLALGKRGLARLGEIAGATIDAPPQFAFDFGGGSAYAAEAPRPAPTAGRALVVRAGMKKFLPPGETVGHDAKMDSVSEVAHKLAKDAKASNESVNVRSALKRGIYVAPDGTTKEVDLMKMNLVHAGDRLDLVKEGDGYRYRLSAKNAWKLDAREELPVRKTRIRVTPPAPAATATTVPAPTAAAPAPSVEPARIVITNETLQQPVPATMKIQEDPRAVLNGTTPQAASATAPGPTATIAAPLETPKAAAPVPPTPVSTTPAPTGTAAATEDAVSTHTAPAPIPAETPKRRPWWKIFNRGAEGAKAPVVPTEKITDAPAPRPSAAAIPAETASTAPKAPVAAPRAPEPAPITPAVAAAPDWSLAGSPTYVQQSRTVLQQAFTQAMERGGEQNAHAMDVLSRNVQKAMDLGRASTAPVDATLLEAINRTIVERDALGEVTFAMRYRPADAQAFVRGWTAAMSRVKPEAFTSCEDMVACVTKALESKPR